MKKLFLFLSLLVMSVTLGAQVTQVKWELSDVENLSGSTITGVASSLVSSSYLEGTNIAKKEKLTAPNAASGFTQKPYNPAFTAYYATTKVTGAQAGHCVSFGMATSITCKASAWRTPHVLACTSRMARRW